MSTSKIHLVDLQPQKRLPSDVLDGILFNVKSAYEKPVLPTVVAPSVMKSVLYVLTKSS